MHVDLPATMQRPSGIELSRLSLGLMAPTSTASTATAAIAAQPNRQAPMAKPQIKAPPPLEHDVDLSTFNAWRQAFFDWAKATGVDQQPRETTTAHLRALLSIKMKAVLQHAIGIQADTQLNVPGILDALYQHIRSTRSVAVDMVEFERRVQGKNESFNRK